MPASASPRATVRCPLCQAEFSLAEILDRLPPALIVVSDPDAAQPSVPAQVLPMTTATADGGEGAEALTLEDASENAEAETADWSLAPAIVVTDRADRGEATTTPAQARKRKVIRRPQRKQQNTVIRGVNVILGGLAGLCVGQLVLWWLPAKYRKDPFQLGPQVAEYAPWIVPATFQGKVAAANGDSALAEKPRQAAKAPAKGEHPKPGQAKPKAKESELPQIQFQFKDPIRLSDEDEKAQEPAAKPKADPFQQPETTETQPAPQPDLTDMAPEAADEEKPDLASLAPDPFGGLMPKPDLATNDVPTVKPVPQDAAPATPASATPTEIHAPPIKTPLQLTAAELKAVLDEAKLAAGVWQAAPLADKKSLFQNYKVLTKLAETLAFTENAAPQDASAARDLLKSLAKNPQKLDFVLEVGTRWMQESKRPNNGVVLVGVVKQISRQGELYETHLETTAGGAVFILISDFDPALTCQVDARILATGVVVPDPAKELNGYQGKAAPAVWLGVCTPVAAP